MSRTAIAVLCIALVAPAIGQETKPQAMPTPPRPFYDWKACPFEGCTYREWTARKTISAYDTWKQGRRAIARVVAGETVTGLTGVVITRRPGKIRIDRDLPQLDLKRGDIVFTYTNLGEGFAKVWFKGRFYPEFDISFTRWPDGQGCAGNSCAATYIDLGESDWWAQVKLKSGRTGWVNMNEAEFDGVDMLASMPHPSKTG